MNQKGLDNFQLGRMYLLLDRLRTSNQILLDLQAANLKLLLDLQSILPTEQGLVESSLALFSEQELR